MNLRNIWRGVFALLVCLVTWLTLTPDPDETKTGLAIARLIAQLLFHDAALGDKVAHFLAYAALGASAALGDLRIVGRRAPTVAALAAYGVFLEFMQGVGGVRVSDPADALANASGALTGCAGAFLMDRLMVRMRPA